jgi:hypothetical protein
MLAKRMGDAWYTKPNNPEEAMEFIEKLDAFFQQHFGCDLVTPYKILLLDELENQEYKAKCEEKRKAES